MQKQAMPELALHRQTVSARIRRMIPSLGDLMQLACEPSRNQMLKSAYELHRDSLHRLKGLTEALNA